MSFCFSKIPTAVLCPCAAAAKTSRDKPAVKRARVTGAAYFGCSSEIQRRMPEGASGYCHHLPLPLLRGEGRGEGFFRVFGGGVKRPLQEDRIKRLFGDFCRNPSVMVSAGEPAPSPPLEERAGGE